MAVLIAMLLSFLTSGMKRANETMELKDRPDYQIWLTGDNVRNVPQNDLRARYR